MLIKTILLALVALGTTAWLIRSRRAHRSSVGKAAKANGAEDAHASHAGHPEEAPGKNGEELDDSQVAEVVATWNLLNPP